MLTRWPPCSAPWGFVSSEPLYHLAGLVLCRALARCHVRAGGHWDHQQATCAHPLAAQKKYRSLGLSSAKPASQICCRVVFCEQTEPGMENCRMELNPAAAQAKVRFVSVRNATRSKFLYVADFSWPAACTTMLSHPNAVVSWAARDCCMSCGIWNWTIPSTRLFSEGRDSEM